jgi:hypothetical protein
LGIKLTRPRFHEEDNQSLDAQRIEVLRRINEILPTFEDGPISWEHAQDIRYIITPCIPEGAPLKALMSDADRATIKARFADVNRELSARYLGGQLSEKWFTTDRRQTPQTQTGAPGDAELVRALSDTIVRLADITRGLEVRRPTRRVKAWWKIIRDKFANEAARRPTVR